MKITKLLKYFALTCTLYMILVSCKTEQVAQQSTPTLSHSLKSSRVLSLQMPNGGKNGEKEGTNGAGVAYHPIEKKWYALFAGNTYFPMGVFKESGEYIKGDAKAQYDARGFWYNPNTKQLEGNGFGDEGIVKIGLDNAGQPISLDVVLVGANHQPSDQSVGAYNPQDNEILYFSESQLIKYDRKTGEKIGINVFKNEINPYDFVDELALYTGWKNAEIGLVNKTKKQIHLFSKSTLKHTATVSLPSDTDVQDRFNFAYSNGIFWVFSIPDRRWDGYKVK